MSIESGSKLGPYEILSLIGAGGMGEVYKAKDTRLDRIIAIKVLPSPLAESSERRERFEREARAVSSLNHPNICVLHDVGEQDGTHYLVMEFIEGETLADRLKKGPLPLEQALRYGIQIADALDKAHRQGVVHRDLKPGNVMLTKPGAKLLDFGLAKLKASGSDEEAPDLSALPTEQKPLTKEGSILGTFQYMAPEQLEGKEADARTDIFALGSVLYEMVAGKRAFEGKSQASLISAIMSSEPRAISELQPMSPPSLDHVITRCLAKEPEDRWQTARDLNAELKWIAEDSGQVVVPGREEKRRSSWWIRAVALAALLGGLVTWALVSEPPIPPSSIRFTVTSTGVLYPVHVSSVALSPDGKHLVYVVTHGGIPRIYHRPMDRLAATPIRGTEGARGPFFSPDGRWLGFFSEGDRRLKKVDLLGGTAQVICEIPAFHGGSWTPDGTIFFTSTHNSALSKVSAAGGTPEEVTTLDSERGETAHLWPQVLPGGQAVIFTINREEAQGGQSIAVLSLGTAEKRILVEGFYGRYVPAGYLLYAQGESLAAVPFDVERLEINGPSVTILEGIEVVPSGTPQIAFSETGSMAYVPGGAELTFNRTLVWVDRRGVEQPLNQAARGFNYPRISPDGQQLAVSISDSGVGYQIWTLELTRGTLSRLTFEGITNSRPVWSPDGERIFFSSNRGGPPTFDIYSKRTDGSGPAEQLTLGTYRVPSSLSSDGKILIYREERTLLGSDIGMLRLDGQHEPELLLNTPFSKHSGKLSPDDRWLAYVSNESGREEIYLRPFPGPGGRVQVSAEGGIEPMWSRNGRELFYRNGDQLMAVSVSTDPELALGKPSLLFEGQYEMSRRDSRTNNYDVAPDGRFIMLRRDETAESSEIVAVMNWFEELKRLVPKD